MDLVDSQMNNETFADDKLSQLIMPATGLQSITTQQEYKTVKMDDPAVVQGLERLARLQQIKRIILEEVEQVLFGDKYHINRIISIIDLSTIFVKTLGMYHNNAITFARFLVEGGHEEGKPEVVSFDPMKTIDL